MPRFVSASVEPVGDSWKLTITSWSVWSGEWSDVSVHLSLMGAVDALLRHRCGDTVRFLSGGGRAGEATPSLEAYLKGRPAPAGQAPPFSMEEAKAKDAHAE
jgi:hypothetical protein